MGRSPPSYVRNMKTTITIAEFRQKVAALIGMPVSRPWKGYGSTIFLDLGLLSEALHGRSKEAEACISIDWDWRLEDDRKIICGSSDSGPKITACLAAIEGLTISAVALEGSPQELVVTFSGGARLRSMSMVSGHPQWMISLPGDYWMSCEEDSLVSSNGTDADGMTPEEQAICDHAEVTAERWGKPVKEPKAGFCMDCWFHVRLDGHFALLDYGVCGAPDSSLDGRVTNMKSGCPSFRARG